MAVPTFSSLLSTTPVPDDPGGFFSPNTSSHGLDLDLSLVTSDNASLLETTATQRTGWKYSSLEKYPHFLVAHGINKYCLNVITAIGFPGNILSFITILKMKPYSHPSIYVAVLAVADNCCLTAKLLLLEFTRHDVDIGDFGCKFIFFAGNSTAMFANWMLVLMTIERFMAIWFPLKVGTFCTRRRAAMAMLCLLVCVGALCSVFFVITSEQWTGPDFACAYKKEYADFVQFVWYWVDGAFFALLPCILLIVFNGLIILGIKRAASIQKRLTEDSSCRSRSLSQHEAEKYRQQRQITIMLVVVCVTFVVLIMPVCIFFIYQPYWQYEPMSEEYANYKLTEQVVYMLSDSSHAVNFFVYFFSTKKFRNRFLATICCCGKWRRHVSRASHVGQFSETGSIYVTTTSNGGFIPLSLRNGGRY